MNLYEYEAKSIFNKNSIEIPKGIIVSNEEELKSLENIKEFVVKPQGIKGRGKTENLVFAKNISEVKNGILKLKSRNPNIKKFLVEEKIDVEKEIYIAITIDFSVGKPVFIVSPQGGIDIEEIVKTYPEKISKSYIDITKGLNKKDLEKIFENLALENDVQLQLLELSQKLYRIFRKYDAEVVEINPLVITKDNRLVAVDAVLNINDDSLFRHPEFEEEYKKRKYRTEFERQMGEMGWSYIDMDGDIGIICSGAGLSMATLDLIQLYGGKPANFLDMAQVDGDGLYRAFEILTKKPNIKAIFVSLFAGLNRCDSMAEGIKRFVLTHNVNIPIIVRMVGNMEEEGTKILKEGGIDNFFELEKAVETVVRVSKSGYIDG